MYENKRDLPHKGNQEIMHTPFNDHLVTDFRLLILRQENRTVVVLIICFFSVTFRVIQMPRKDDNRGTRNQEEIATLVVK